MQHKHLNVPRKEQHKNIQQIKINSFIYFSRLEIPFWAQKQMMICRC